MSESEPEAKPEPPPDMSEFEMETIRTPGWVGPFVVAVVFLFFALFVVFFGSIG